MGRARNGLENMGYSAAVRIDRIDRTVKYKSLEMIELIEIYIYQSLISLVGVGSR